MKIKLFSIAVFFIINANSQIIDSTKVATKKNKLSFKHFILPTALITTGLLLKETPTNERLQTDIIKILGEEFDTEAENYFQFAPIIQMYAGNYLGLKSKNNFKQQTINTLVANAITTAIVVTGKHSFLETRPNGRDNFSFPSGHTSTAFTNATLLFYEYKDSNIWYSSSGYLFAATTGYFRIAKNKHYTSDVLAGAGIGIGVGLAVSYWSPFKSFTVCKNKTHAIIYPQVGENYGIGLLIKN
jgi:PAP2 superfamily